MNTSGTVAKAVVAGLILTLSTACGDLVVKVQKKPKDVDLSALQNFEALNLNDSQDFLKHLDGLKVVAVDFLMKELARRDYRSEVREAIRNYRLFLIERATKPVKVDDSFYASADECRQTGLSFNMDEANNFLGIILKTAVLAKISEVSATKLNPGISKELAAIGQLVLMELGLKIEGDVSVDEVDGVTTTTGNVTIALSEIAGEDIDEATKKADAAEVITLGFSRALGADYVGTFSATIDVGHMKADESTETLEGKMAVERKQVDEKFVHDIAFSLGVKDGAVNYARDLSFEQVDGKKHQVKVTDTLKPGTDDDKSYVTIIDVKEGTQCKYKADGDDAGSDDDGAGDEGGFIPTETGTGTSTSTSTATDTDTTTATDTDTATETTTATSTATATSTSDDDGDDKPTGGDDDKPTGDDDDKPTQTPTQHPTQSPTQKPVAQP